MDRKFYEGQKLKAIFFDDDDESVFDSTTDNIKSITVVMENGQMAPVPWALVVDADNRETKWNIALLAGVELMEEDDVCIN